MHIIKTSKLKADVLQIDLKLIEIGSGFPAISQASKKRRFLRQLIEKICLDAKYLS
jgi:hypothetical protein